MGTVGDQAHPPGEEVAFIERWCLPGTQASSLRAWCPSVRLAALQVSVVVQSLRHVRLLVTPWAAARQASLSVTNSRSLPKLMSIESVMPSNHLILCHPFLLLPSDFSQHQGLFQ